MPRSDDTGLLARLDRWRWQAPVLAFLLVLAHQVVEHTWLVRLPRWQHFATQLLFYGLVGPSMAWVALSSLRRSVQRAEQAREALLETQTALEKTNQRLELLIDVNHKLAAAEDEESLIAMILELPLRVVSAVGCTLIPFDDLDQPLPAIHRGSLDPSAFESWSRHLAAPEIRERCSCCSSYQAVDRNRCPVLQYLPDGLVVRKVFCLELVYSERLYGVLNLYLEDPNSPTESETALLQAMASEMSLALAGQRLISRELTAFQRVKETRRLEDLRAEMAEVLVNITEALGADGAGLDLPTGSLRDTPVWIEAGEPLGPAKELVVGIADGMRGARSPLVIGDLEQGHGAIANLRSLLIAPLQIEAEDLGKLLIWSAKVGAFSRRQSRLAGTLAWHVALLLENHRLYLRADYQASLAERSRLAREIHDGLAQTLGYLKLRAAQISDWLAAGKLDRVETAMVEIRERIGEAYTDARLAIDGLRYKPLRWDVADWLPQLIAEFEEMSAIPVETHLSVDEPLEPGVQAQLQRIVHEALSNISKHAEASQVHVSLEAEAGWLRLRICDDGRGFDPGDVPVISRHGLRSMRERAEFMDGEFQLVSHPGAGTEVLLHLPLREARLGSRNA